jgi:molybdopterin/thiamine biosynthesis adenylyltransferase
VEGLSETGPDLTPSARERFDRNLRLAPVGEAGQRRLLAASALVVGAGGLGSAAIYYLAAAGIGRIRIADAGYLERSNLNRQILHRSSDIGRPKTDSARDAVLAFWPECRVETVAERITEATAPQVVGGADVVLDCADNFPTRFIIADACWREGVPLVSAAVLRFEGHLISVIPAEGSPCYRCLIPGPPPAEESPTAAQVGILGAVAGMFGAIQATEAVKVILGIGRTFAHRMLIYDGLAGTMRTVRRTRDPACRFCGSR